MNNQNIDKYLAYAVGFFVSDDGDQFETNEEIIEALWSGNPDGIITFWEPFEGSCPQWVAGQIESMAGGLSLTFPGFNGGQNG